ncbi:MAG TPA: rubrerythrin family protein [Candidatus Hydrogenedentes bacterium]|nr:rubrerythrin family protein [Candidatus Hydrogenedentota bacterium]
MKKSYLFGAMCVAALMIIGWAGNALAQETAKSTLDNLQAAFNGESNAKAKYEAFAIKADEEGYKQVASLFRAAAHAEGIHAASHGKVITDMGATPKADVGKPEVKSTKENLEAALKGESYERDTMYPAFIKQAEADKNQKASRTFNWAISAETEHAKLYQEALGNLDAWKAGPKEFIVCQKCGYTTAKTDIKQCPVCSNPRSKMDAIK